MTGDRSRLEKCYLPAYMTSHKYPLISVKLALRYKSLTCLPSSRVYGLVSPVAFEEGISLDRRNRKKREYSIAHQAICCIRSWSGLHQCGKYRLDCMYAIRGKCFLGKALGGLRKLWESHQDFTYWSQFLLDSPLSWLTLNLACLNHRQPPMGCL